MLLGGCSVFNAFPPYSIACGETTYTFLFLRGVFLYQSGKVSDRLCNGTILLLVEKANNVMIQVEVEFIIVDFRSGEIDW